MPLPIQFHDQYVCIDYFRWKMLLIGRRLRQADLAPAVGMTESELSRAVHGRRRLLPGQAQRLAEAIGVDASSFLLDAAPRDAR